jgi:hypothetical protein
MIAAAKGHEKSVKKLIRLGASLVHSVNLNLPNCTFGKIESSSSNDSAFL